MCHSTQMHVDFVLTSFVTNRSAIERSLNRKLHFHGLLNPRALSQVPPLLGAADTTCCCEKLQSGPNFKLGICALLQLQKMLDTADGRGPIVFELSRQHNQQRGVHLPNTKHKNNATEHSWCQHAATASAETTHQPKSKTPQNPQSFNPSAVNAKTLPYNYVDLNLQ